MTIVDASQTSLIIYLAAPYSNDAPNFPARAASAGKRLARFNAITEAARILVERGEIVYSPLTMTHPIDIRMKNQQSSAFWVAFDEAFMNFCGRIAVLKLPGWDQSSGVERELQYFMHRAIEPEWLDPAELGIAENVEEFAEAFT